MVKRIHMEEQSAEVTGQQEQKQSRKRVRSAKQLEALAKGRQKKLENLKAKKLLEAQPDPVKVEPQAEAKPEPQAEQKTDATNDTTPADPADPADTTPADPADTAPADPAPAPADPAPTAQKTRTKQPKIPRSRPVPPESKVALEKRIKQFDEDKINSIIESRLHKKMQEYHANQQQNRPQIYEHVTA